MENKKYLDNNGLSFLVSTIKKHLEKYETKLPQGNTGEVLTCTESGVEWKDLTEHKWSLSHYTGVKFEEISTNTWESEPFIVSRGSTFNLKYDDVFYGISDNNETNATDVTFGAVKVNNERNLGTFTKNKQYWMKWNDNTCKIRMRFTISNEMLTDVKLICVEPMQFTVTVTDPDNFFNGNTPNIYAWVKPYGYQNPVFITAPWPGDRMTTIGNVTWQSNVRLDGLSVDNISNIYSNSNPWYEHIGYIINGGDNQPQTVNLYVGTKSNDDDAEYYLENLPFDSRTLTINNGYVTLSINNMNESNSINVPLCSYEDLPDYIKKVIDEYNKNKSEG